jgi:RNA-directed DNA polymerase
MIKLPRKQTFYSLREFCVHLRCEQGQLKELAERAGSYYKRFDEHQGGKARHIDSPQNALKSIQSKIARFLRSSVSFPDTMQGGTKGGSPKKNAEVHVGQQLVFKLDIRDCFPSIGNKRVFSIFREQLNLSNEISSILTKLTTFQRRLPQGAPTSSILANLALLPLHNEIQALCKPRGVNCTFFVDDITLSGDRVREAVGGVIALIQKHGFSMRPRKVKLLARHRDEQNVTGVVVNGGRPSIGRTQKTKIATRIHKLSAFKTISESDYRSIRSLIAHAKHISRPQGEKLEKLAHENLPKRRVQIKKPLVRKVRLPCRSTHQHSHRRLKKRAGSGVKELDARPGTRTVHGPDG